MAGTLIVKPLGLVLQQAGLVSSEQVQIALAVREVSSQKKIGEIMAIKGWIQQQTADFFAEQWPQLIEQQLDRPLGQYLKAAGLLNDAQINIILQTQKTTGQRFGAIAVIKGLISQQTIDFFLEQLELITLKTRKSADSGLSERATQIMQVENYLLYNQQCQPLELMKLYQQVWQQQAIAATGTIAETELLNSGLVVKEHNLLKLSHQRHIFDRHWLEQPLTKLEPYSKIRLKLFGLETKASLPYKVLTEVKYWTNNQPFLTQKSYQILQQKESFIAQGQEAAKIEALIRKYIIDDWQTGIAQEHFRQLSSALLYDLNYSPISLLQTYRQIWQQLAVPSNGSLEQARLLEIGLIAQQDGLIKVANRIYREVFNHTWIDRQLAALNKSLTNQQSKATANSTTPQSDVVSRRRERVVKFLPLILLSASLLWLGSNLLAKYRQINQFHQANQLWQTKNYQQAVAAYDRLLQSQASNRPHQLWINRGYALAGLKQYHAMLHSCSAATAIKPNAPLGWNCQGEALYYLGQYESAVAAFDKALALNPQEAIFWLNKSESLFKLQRYQAVYNASQQTTQLLERKLKNNNNQINQSNLTLAYNQMGEVLLIRQQHQQALAAFEQALVYAPNYLAAQQGKGIALYKLGRSQPATAMFKTVLQRKDLSQAQQAMAWLYQGMNYCNSDQFTAAQKAFKRALTLTRDRQSRAIAQAGCGIR